MPGPKFGSMFSLAHQAHIALSRLMTSRARAWPSPPLIPTIIWPSGHLTLCQVLSCGRQRQIKTLVNKNIFLSFMTRKVRKLAVSVRERNRDEGLGHRLVEDCYTDIFFNLCCDSIFRALQLCLFDGRFSAEGRLPLSVCTCRCPTDWLFCLWVPVYT